MAKYWWYNEDAIHHLKSKHKSCCMYIHYGHDEAKKNHYLLQMTLSWIKTHTFGFTFYLSLFPRFKITISLRVRVKAWGFIGDKPWPEPMMAKDCWNMYASPNLNMIIQGTCDMDFTNILTSPKQMLLLCIFRQFRWSYDWLWWGMQGTVFSISLSFIKCL